MTEIIEIAFWYGAVALCFGLMILFLIQYKKRESLSRPFFLGLSIFMLSYGIARLIENIRRYSVGSYNDIFEAWIAGEQIIGINFWMRFLYYLIAWVGIALLYFNIEKFIFKKNKFALTILSLIEGTTSIINYFSFNMITYWSCVIIFFGVGFFMPILFLNLARKSPSGHMRIGCLMIAIGMFTFVVSVMIDLPETYYFMYLFKQEAPETIIRLIAPIMLILGLLLFSMGFKSFLPSK